MQPRCVLKRCMRRMDGAAQRRWLRSDTTEWCSELADAQLRAARTDGIDAVLPEAKVIESAYLATLPHHEQLGEAPQRQVGHLDMEPVHLPAPDVLPSGVVAITPLDSSTVVWIVPLHTQQTYKPCNKACKKSWLL